MLRWVVSVCVCFLVTDHASAGPIAFNSLDSDEQAWFYNRPGVTLSEWREDTSSCAQFARTVVSDGQRTNSQMYGLAGDVLAGLNSGAPTAWFHDNCMIARGYKRYTVSDRNQRLFADRYSAMSEVQRMSLISSDIPPEGVLTRRWGNDYWTGAPSTGDDLRRLEMRAGATSGVPSQELALADISAPVVLDTDQVLLIFSVQFGVAATRRGAGVQFTRDDPISGMPHKAGIGRNGALRWPKAKALVRESNIAPDNAPNHFAFVAPAGFYSLSALQAFGSMPLNLCMGTMAFEAAPGSVIYLGNFVFSKGSERVQRFGGSEPFSVRIDLAGLQEARAQLSASSELAARLEQVSYRNGFVRPCGFFNEALRPVYGIDFPGAPWFATKTGVMP